MVQASASKAIDFSAAETRDRRWWLKLSWILDRLEETNIVELLKLQHAQNIALLDYKTSQEALDKHWKTANQLITEINTLNFPWYDTKVAKQNNYDAFIDDWEKTFGSRKDPKTQEMIRRSVEALKKKSEMHRQRQQEALQRQKEQQARLLQRARGKKGKK